MGNAPTYVENVLTGANVLTVRDMNLGRQDACIEVPLPIGLQIGML